MCTFCHTVYWQLTYDVKQLKGKGTIFPFYIITFNEAN